MALTLLREPQEYNFSRNPIPISVIGGTDWQNPTPAIQTQLRLDFPVTVVDGDTILISINGQTIPIIFKTTPPDDSGLYPLEGTTDPTYIINTVNTLNTNTSLNQYLTITNATSPDGILFSADYEYSLEIDSGAFGTLSIIDSGSSAIYPQNYHIRLKVSPPTTNPIIFKGIPALSAPYGTPFDLGGKDGILDCLLSPTLPPFYAYDIIACPTNILEINYEYTEGSGAIPLYKKRNFGSQFYVLKGGLSLPDYPNNTYLDPVTAIIPLNIHTTKQTTPTAHEYAYILSTTFSGAVKLKASGLKKDGTHFTAIMGLFSNLIDPHSVYAIPCHASLITFSMANVVKYTLELLDNTNTSLLTLGTYILDTCPVITHNILFENQYGGFTSLSCNRFITHGIEVKKQEAARFLNYDYTPSDSPTFTFKTEAFKTMLMATRFLPLAEIQTIYQLFTASQVYYQGETAYLPLKILTNSIALYTDGDNLYALEFQAAYTYDI